MAKIFVEITARHNTDGSVRPLSMTWEDERVFPIDRVLDIRQAPALKVGGYGIRYTCKVYLFNEQGRWFLES